MNLFSIIKNIVSRSWPQIRRPEVLVLLIFGLIQCMGITDPPLEMAHSWRQSFTAMVTRNYVELGMDWLHPRIDMAGEKTGIVGAEFPLFNFLSFLPSHFFGYQHWYGRCVNLLVVLWGAYNFFGLLKETLTARIAHYAMIVLLCSSWFTFSRKMMPDTFSVSLVLVGLRFGLDYWQTGRWGAYFMAIVAVALGVLSKIPAMSLLAVVGIIPFLKHSDKRKIFFIYLGVFMAVLPALWWYFFWVPYLNQTHGYHLYFPKGLLQGLKEIAPLWRLLLEKFYFTSFYSFIALAMAILGVLALVLRKSTMVLLSLGLVALVFGVFILKTGAVFPLHTYYSVPFIPVMAIAAGIGLDFLSTQTENIVKVRFRRNAMGYFFLLALVVEAISNQIHDHFIKPSERYKLTLETEIASVIPIEAKVVLVSSASPQELFLLHRRGWTIYPEQLLHQRDAINYRTLGARYVVINKPVLKTFADRDSVLLALRGSTRFYESSHYSIYRL